MKTCVSESYADRGLEVTVLSASVARTEFDVRNKETVLSRVPRENKVRSTRFCRRTWEFKVPLRKTAMYFVLDVTLARCNRLGNATGGILDGSPLSE